MTQLSASHPLVSRIAGLRQRARLLLGLYGLGFTLLTLTVGIMVLVTIDCLIVHIDKPVARLGLMAGLLVVVAIVAWRKLIAPLSTRLTDQFLASRVELVNKSLADELMSALQFISQDTGRENIMAAKVVEGAQQRAEGVKFESALEFRAAGRSILVAVVMLAVMGILGAANFASGNTGIAFSRWANPFGGAMWPHMQDVAFDWSAFPGGKKPEVWPQGEPITIAAKVTKGFDARRIASLYFSSDTVRESRDLMTLQEAKSKDGVGIYQKDVTATGEANMSLRVVYGDFYDEQDIRLAPRPAVSGLKATVEPPAYVTEGSVARTFDLLMEPGRAVEGSRVHLLVKSSKALESVNGVPSVTILKSDGNEPMDVADVQKKLVDPFNADLSFLVSKTMEFRIQVRDTDGFTNTAMTTTRIEVTPDALPSVIITSPLHEIAVLPDAEVMIRISVSDDLGLSKLILQADGYDAKPGAAPRFITELPIANITVDGAARTVVGSAVYQLKLAGLTPALKPGDRLQVYALVRDNYALPEATAGKGDNFEMLAPNQATDPLKQPADGLVHHRLVRSSAVTLVVKSKDQIITDAVKEMEHLAAEIQQVHDQQKVTQGKTEVLQKAFEQSHSATAQQQEELQKLAQDQAGEAQRSNAIQQKFDQLRETLANNKMDQDPIGKLAEKASEVMKDVGQQDMPKAAGDLNQAKDAAQKAGENQQKSDAPSKTQAQQQAQNAADAAKAAQAPQQAAADKMDQIAKEIMQKGQLAQVSQKIDDLKNRTDANQAAEKKIDQQTQGKPASDLSPSEKAAQDQVAQEQQKLAEEQQKLEQQLKDMAKDMEKTNPAGAKAAEKAQQTSQQQQIAQKQAQAGQSAQQNQGNNAQQQQSQASAGLAQMQQDIKDAQKYEQQRIAAETAALLKAVTEIRDQQVVAKASTEKAGDKAATAVLMPLGDKESRMNLNLVTLRDRSAQLPDGQKVAADLKDAQGGMQDATASLYTGKQPPAVTQEGDAVLALNKAIDKLQTAKDKNDVQQAKDDLAEIRKQFEDARQKEIDFKTRTSQIDTRRQDLGQLPAADNTALGTMSTKQGELADNVHTLTTGKLQEFEEYVWITNQVVEFMGESKSRLGKAETGREVAVAQDSAITRLTSIIEALKEEEREKDKFLSEPQKGGGGGGGGGKKPLIPPLAELKLLKRLQLIENQETMDMNKALDAAANDSEKSDVKRQVERLGAEQNKVSDLAQKVYDKLKQN